MSWHNKNTGAYARTSTEAQDNAKMVYDVLSGCGWILDAVSAMLGNVEHESGYNPWRWQSDNVLATTNTYEINNQTGHAYGLCQQDPAGKYINSTYAQMISGFGPNFSDQAGSQNDGNSQMYYLHHVCESGLPEWDATNPMAQGLGLPYSDFIVNTPGYTVAQLTRTFFGCYERGTWSTTRVTAAEYWYNFLQNYSPQPPADTGSAWFAVFHLLGKKKKGTILYRHKNKPGGGFR